MQDEHDDGDDQKEMYQSSGNMKREPGSSPSEQTDKK
jgi:hypothetical protein